MGSCWRVHGMGMSWLNLCFGKSLCLWGAGWKDVELQEISGEMGPRWAGTCSECFKISRPFVHCLSWGIISGLWPPSPSPGPISVPEAVTLPTRFFPPSLRRLPEDIHYHKRIKSFLSAQFCTHLWSCGYTIVYPVSLSIAFFQVSTNSVNTFLSSWYAIVYSVNPLWLDI